MLICRVKILTLRNTGILGLFILASIRLLLAQAPNLMSYQAVIWDGSGNLVSEKIVSIKISILQGSVTGPAVFSETHRIQSNVNGLVSLLIGGGTSASGKISDINWGGGSYFLKTETDPTGGANFSINGTTQLVSVPYAIHSNTSNNLVTPTPGLPGQILTVDKDGKPIWVSTLSTVNTTNSSNITPNSAVSGGNITSDGGAPITSRGIVWSTFPNPTVSLSTKTNNGTGLGVFSSTLSGLISNTTYYARAYATNNVGTGYGNEINFTTSSGLTMNIPCPGTPIVKDIDGNSYNTVQIGTQCWTKENLKVTKYNDNSAIPLEATGSMNGISSTWQKLTTGAYSIYANEISTGSNTTIYGLLYNWYAAKGIATIGSNSNKNICPMGWHIPTDGEWTILTNFLGGDVAGGKMKQTGTTLWNAPNNGADNASGFTALPAGYRDISGSFLSIRQNAFFWSTSEDGNNYACYRNLVVSNSTFSRYINYKSVGGSVRCLRD